MMVPTGSSSLLVALVRIPPSVRAPASFQEEFPAGSGSTDPTIGLVAWDSSGNSGLGATQGIDCALPTTQAQICAASLAYFLVTSDVGKRLSPITLQADVQQLDSFVAGQTPPTGQGLQPGAGGETKECDPFGKADLNANPGWVKSIDDQLEKVAKRAGGSLHLPINIASLNIPGGYSLASTPSFDIGVGSLCATALPVGKLRQPEPWTQDSTGDNVLSFQAQRELGASVLGFTYSATETGWIEPPNLPSSESKTQWQWPKADFVPGADLTYTSQGLHAGLVLFRIVIASVNKHNLKLLSSGEELLVAGLQPTLSFQIEITKGDLIQRVADKVAETGDASAGERLAAQQLSDDIAAGIESQGEGFFGFTTSQIERKLAQDIYPELLQGFQSEVAGLATGTADAAAFADAGVTSDEIPALLGASTPAGAVTADAVTADTAASLDAGEVAGSKFLCVLFFGGPEDLIGDAVCAAL